MVKVSFSGGWLVLLLYYNKLLVVAQVENWKKNWASHCQGSFIHIIQCGHEGVATKI